ncbi:hypothetical protein V1264_016809 [Littorina saxatilis]|uniref:Uncharacterized protein n=1 Tax=Littorina saxatilis TaxID=31220 RepID=A0AAN9BI89_9CAEN
MGNFFSVFISVGVSLALLNVTIILVVVCCRKANCRACAPRSGRRSPADAVTFRQVPIEERDGVNSDESHHAYIEVIDDSGEPGTGKTSSHGAEDDESDGYLHPYTSPTAGTYGHSYSSLATRRAKPDDYLNPIPSTSESTAAARTPDSESPYEIV